MQKIDSHGLVRLLRFARSETRALLAGTFFLAVGSGLSLAYPRAIRRIIDETVGSRSLARIDQVAWVVLAIFVVQAVASAIRYYLFTTAGERIVVRIRQALYRALLVQEIAFFDSRRTGELLSRLASDSTVLQNALSVNISMAARNLAAAIGGFALLLYTSARLTLIMLAVIPPVAVSAARFGKSIRGQSKRSQDALAEAAVVAEETLSGIRTVRAFAQEPHEMDRYGRALDRAFVVAREKILRIAWFTGGASILGYVAVVGVLWYGGRLVVQGQLSLGDLTSYLLYVFMVGFSVASLGGLWTDFMSATGAAKRIFEILDRRPAIPISGGARLEKLAGAVAFRNVTFHYPARPEQAVLTDISFDIKPGAVVALVGPSGSGKTTIASLIPRFYDPLKGAVLVDGQNIRALDIEWLRHAIGIVSQEPILLSDTIAENIRYGRATASDEEVERAAISANAHEFISNFPDGYRTLVGEKGVQLSGGQKQRVAIARAVLKDPKILILDEATSALDAESEFLVKEALDRLMKGRTTLVIAHRLSTVKDADEVMVIDRGAIVQRGSHQTLLGDEAGLYHRLIDRQFIAR